MKKLYCALAAAALAFSANAADYYLIGGFNGWSLKQANCKFTDMGDGTYELNYDGTLISGFKINDGTWDNANANFGGSGTLQVGQVFNLTVGGSSGNINMSENVANPHLVFNPTAKTLLVTGQGQEVTYSYGLWGDFDGSGNWRAIDLTETDGKWVSAETTVAACSFGIKKLDAGTGSQIEWLSSAGAAAVTVGTAMDLQVEGTNFTIAAGKYTFTVDPEAMTLLVSGEGGGDDPIPPTPGEKDLYLVGEMTGWGKDAAYKMTQNGLVYTIELEEGLSGAWKIWDGTWDYNLGATDTTEPASGVATNVTFNGSNFNAAYSGKTTIELTLPSAGANNGTLVVTYEGVVEPWPVEEWYVSVQGPFNEWKGEGQHPDAEGVATVSGLALNAEGFKVKVYNGLGDLWYCNGAELTLDTPATIEGNIDTLMTVAGLEEGKEYVVTYNVLTSQLTVKEDTNTAVEAVEVAAEAPVYFNLQGVKVANPANGIYVKVANGKATKVVL